MRKKKMLKIDVADECDASTVDRRNYNCSNVEPLSTILDGGEMARKGGRDDSEAGKTCAGLGEVLRV